MFKVIQIQVQKRSFSLHLLRLGNIFAQILLTAHTIQKSRKKIIICLSLDLFLINLLICNIVERTQTHFPSINPADCGLAHIQPAVLLNGIGFLIIMGSRHLLFREQQLIQVSRLDTVGKQLLELLIGVQKVTVLVISHINSASCVLQNCLQRCIGTGQRILCDPL